MFRDAAQFLSREAGDLVKELAEREGFEPPIPFRVCPLSRRIVSTTHAPLRAKKRYSADFIISEQITEPAGHNRHIHEFGLRCKEGT